jgi:Protein of unknown function (DUF3667)
MNELVGNLGDVASGALVAHAVEPDRSGPTLSEDGHTREAACLNCHIPLAGAFCHACGQRAHLHKTLMSLVHDLAHGVFHFEGKIWRTLPMLAWKPGEVTRRYIDGERARFVSPLALFLFSVFVLAAVLGSLPGKGAIDGLREGWNASGASTSKIEQMNKAALGEALKQREAMVRAGKPTTDVDGKISRIRGDQEALTKLAEDRPSDVVANTNMRSKLEFINERWKHAKANPDLLIYKLKNSAYKFSWVLVPLSLPFVWLLFPFSRRFGMYDHAIFVIYSLASMSLLTVALATLAVIPVLATPVSLGFAFLPPMHMYRQLRGTYSLGRVSAVVRTLLLLLCVVFVFTLWVCFLVVVGAA